MSILVLFPELQILKENFAYTDRLMELKKELQEGVISRIANIKLNIYPYKTEYYRIIRAELIRAQYIHNSIYKAN